MAKLREKLEIVVDEQSGPAYGDAILSGQESLNALMDQKHPWVFLSSYAQDVPMPPWILNRIEEMRRQVEASGAARERGTRKSRGTASKKAGKKRK
jgi:phage protein U